jgi:hypothetical protein
MSTWELPCEERDFSFFSVLIKRAAEKEGVLGNWASGVAYIHRTAEKAHSQKLVVASPATNIPFYTGQNSATP